MMQKLLICVCLAAFLVLSASSLVIKSLPHFQTFDSWDTCVSDGVCYETDCSESMQGGWITPPLEEIPFSSQTWGWWINSGPTPSNRDITTRELFSCSELRTGPCADHTTNSTGNYIYVEASGCADSDFSATSPTIVFTNTSATLSFYYYLWGNGLDGDTSFRVFMNASNDEGSSVTNQQIFSKTDGDASQSWQYASISLTSHFPGGNAATTANPVTAVFTFRVHPASDRNNYRSDIAIDDVLFTQSGAPSPSPYIDPSPSPSASPPSAPGESVSSGDSGLTDAEIGGIVGGVIGGLLLLAILLGLVLVGILLVISPKGPAGPAPAPNAGL